MLGFFLLNIFYYISCILKQHTMKKLILSIAVIGMMASCKKESPIENNDPGTISFYKEDLVSRRIFFNNINYSVPFTSNTSCGSSDLLTFKLSKGTYSFEVITGTYSDFKSITLKSGECVVIRHEDL